MDEVTKGEEPCGTLAKFPCRHPRQQAPDRSTLPCAWPGCSRGEESEVVVACGRTFERRVTGGTYSPLLYLWRDLTKVGTFGGVGA